MDKIIDDIMNGKHKLSAYGEFVREMRQYRGLYLNQMADFIGISSAQMSGIEFGRHELTKEILQKTFEFFTQTPAVEPVKHKYTDAYVGNVVGIYKDGEQMTIQQIVDDLNGKTVEQAQSGWLRAIDEALVCHHIDVANADDDYATAKDKLNKLLCVVQDIGAYFAKQEPAQAVPLDSDTRKQLLDAFPLLDDEGLSETEHHCEWAIQQDRKRLHKILKRLEAGE